MLDYGLIYSLPLPVYEYYYTATQEIIADIARRISKEGYITATASNQMLKLQEIGAVEDYVLHKLAEATSLSQDALIALFNESATLSLTYDDKIYRAAGYNPMPVKDNPALQQIINAGLRKTNGTFKNLTATTARTASQQFENILDDAYNKLLSGAFSYQEVIKQGIKELASKGVSSITYPSGRTDTLDVAFRRATLTGMNQTALNVQEHRLKEFGIELVETTAHAGARPEHAEWQGKVFAWHNKLHPKYPDFVTVTGYGSGDGLGGWNCSHGFYPYIEGVSETANTKAYLAELNNKTVMLYGKPTLVYDALQRQREIERTIRRWKREAAALEAANIDNTTESNKIKDWQAKAREFVKETGLHRDYFRERAGQQLAA